MVEKIMNLITVKDKQCLLYDQEINYYHYCCYLIPQAFGVKLSKNKNPSSSKHFSKAHFW